jgi:L-alanine-DL-glutamate epimerase-like enolase superfamily enzyme
VGVIGGKHWLFVKVETDEGIHGWGEAYTQLDTISVGEPI